ncbi:hypothetical protein GCM10009716_07510 [Streptomyces sodiiphilus]|uniref:ATP synthase protein I n=1 Tax=Streptomyces sodiiphilus TaxID=226217 RepID=A0ABN2NS87_9ACTN
MQSNDARIIRGAAIPTAVVGVIVTAAGAVVAGADGALGAALGSLVAAAFFGVGLVALGHVGHRWPELFFGAAFLIYTTQVVLLVIAMALLRDATFLNGRAFAAGVLACLFAWLTGQVVAHVRLKAPYVDPTPSSGPEGPGSGGPGGPGQDGRA